MTRTARIGIDVGGTFTDFVLHDQARGITHTGKRLTTPDSPTRAIVEGLKRLLSESETPIGRVGNIVHGTTLATNTLLERTGPTVGLITTEGFRDLLEMGREIRFDVNDLNARPASVLIPRQRRIGVGGRIAANGTEHVPLDEPAVRTAVRRLVDGEAVETVAVAFLHSYANPAHEYRAAEIIRDLHPGLRVTLSAEVAPIIGEYERTTTACVNAYVQPVIEGHLGQLQAQLAALGFAGELHIMLSGGGLTTVEHASRFPIKLLESGPAAGAITAAYLATLAGEKRVISFDMGGTTAKMCVIDDGIPARSHNFEAARAETFKPGSGLPMRLTVIDMIEIGSGGGSIASVDDLGLLAVGPRSAGSLPGPIAYDRGGQEPTVTDADLVLGQLDPDSFLGGEMRVAVADLTSTLDRRLGRPLGLDAKSAAVGIQDVLTESMAAATRTHLAERGGDPTAYSLMAFGGAGPVHAYALAKRLKMRRIIIPPGAGVASAFGFLVAAPAVDAATSCPAPLDRVDWKRVTHLLDAMEANARVLLAAAAGDDVEISLRRSADMRYLGQGHEIEVELPAGALGSDRAGEVGEAFSDAYRATFGRTIENATPELVSVRSLASAPRFDITLPRHSEQAGPRPESRRPVYFLGFGELDAVVYNRGALEPGTVLRGPVVIQERDTSCSLGPDCLITVDERQNLIVDIQPSAKAKP